MKLYTVDLETYWTKTHSLSKMLPMEYCMHPDTEIISLAFKYDRFPTDVVFGEDNIKQALERIDFSDAMVIGHNLSNFDSMILRWRLGIQPKMWGCTLSMARPIHAIDVGGSLSKLVEHYGLGKKDNTILMNTQGKRLADFTPDELDAMRTYNAADTDQCYALFHKLAPHYNAKELWHIDATIRMLIEPKFVTDTAMLEAALSMERDLKRKAVLLVAKELKLPWVDENDEPKTSEQVEEEVRVQMASAAKFGALLQTHGVEVPMKPSPTNPEKMTPALAKTDQAFIDMQDHEDPVVAAAARARLAVKSTLLETRIGAFLTATQAANGLLPIPLNYCGATTTGRWCLAEGTLVTVRDMNGVVFDLPIEDVGIEYEVWDGIEWVNHSGVVFSGDKPVVTWDGVTATAEHIVWVDPENKVTLGHASANALTLWSGNDVPDIQADLSVRAVLHRVNEANGEHTVA